MPDASANTIQLHSWLARMRDGDLAARDELLRSLCGRLERLARKMLQRFPSVQRWAQTDDVLQNSLLRLMRALQEVQPGSMRDFFGLAAEQMRRELLDMARHFHGPHGLAAHHESHLAYDSSPSAGLDAPDPAGQPGDLEQWCAFHQQVERLPVEEREVVGLIFYHGWTQADVADVLQVNVRTIRRRWESAMVKLHQVLNAGQNDKATESGS